MIDTYGMNDINTQAIRELTTEVDGVKNKTSKEINNIKNSIDEIENTIEELEEWISVPIESLTLVEGITATNADNWIFKYNPKSKLFAISIRFKATQTLSGGVDLLTGIPFNVPLGFVMSSDPVKRCLLYEHRIICYSNLSADETIRVSVVGMYD